MIILLILGLVFIGLCVLSFFCAREVNLVHVIVGPIVFLLACFALVESAAHLHRTGKWRTRYEKARARLAELHQRWRELRFGVPGDATNPPERSVLALTARFNRVSHQRGRVWRWCRLLGTNAGFQLQLLPDNVPEGVAHGLTDGTLVYAFLEQIPVDQDGDGQEDRVDTNGDGQPDRPLIRLPGAYLGEFAVKKSDAKTVTLQPTRPLDQLQRRVISPDFTWVLYESMPVDDHYVFAEDTRDGYVQLNVEPDQEVFGHRDPETLKATFLAAVRANFPAMPAAQQEQFAQLLVAPYLRDGKRLTEDEAQQLPQEAVWYKVEF
ncbi:MAG TPA: hypothetical protein ENJ50_00415, partial [Planctomycetaceae bacterium]|nr:hypothetical protein [Planctomycetaceae bacterium]